MTTIEYNFSNMEIKNYLYHIDTVIYAENHRESKFPSECYYDILIGFSNKEELRLQLEKFTVGKRIGIHYKGDFLIRDIYSIEYKKCIANDKYRNYDMITIKVRPFA